MKRIILTITVLLLLSTLSIAEEPVVEIVTSEMIYCTVGNEVVPEPVVKAISEVLKEDAE